MTESIISPQPARPKTSDDAGSPKTTNAAAPHKSEAPDIQALKGSTTIDDKVSIEAEILAFQAVAQIAEAIAVEFGEKFPKEDRKGLCVIFLDENTKSAIAARQTFALNMDSLAEEFKYVLASGDAAATTSASSPAVKETETELVSTRGPQNLEMLVAPAALAGGLAAASSLSRSAIDLFSLFRQDTSYSGRSYTVKDIAVVLEIAKRIMALPDVVCYCPQLLPLPPGPSGTAALASVEARVNGVQELRAKAKETLRQLSQGCLELQMKIAPLKPNHPPSASEVLALTSRLIQKKSVLETEQKSYDAAAARLDKYIGDLSAADSSGATLWQAIAKAEEIFARYEKYGNYTLFFATEVVTLAGGYRVRSSLWRTLFNSDGLSYSGGAIISYAVLDSNGDVCLCGTHRWRTPFIRFAERNVQSEDISSLE